MIQDGKRASHRTFAVESGGRARGLCAKDRGTHQVALLLRRARPLEHRGRSPGGRRGGVYACCGRGCGPPLVRGRFALRFRGPGRARCSQQHVHGHIFGERGVDRVPVGQGGEELLDRVNGEVVEIEICRCERPVHVYIARSGRDLMLGFQYETNLAGRGRSESVQPRAALLGVERARREFDVDGVHHRGAVQHPPVDEQLLVTRPVIDHPVVLVGDEQKPRFGAAEYLAREHVGRGEVGAREPVWQIAVRREHTPAVDEEVEDLPQVPLVNKPQRRFDGLQNRFEV